MYGKDQSLIETKPECQTLLTEFFCYNIKYNIKQTSDENKEKYQLGDY